MFFRIIAIASFIYLMLWIFQDAKRVGYSYLTAFLWGISIFLVPLISLPAYFILRFKRMQNKEKTTPKHLPKLLCPRCGQDNTGHDKTCTNCGNNLTL
ncbi:hypothetical protein DID77_00970 [Candidatus Marinamargulisbacteria bacterium SCGC AG-439-L15]|nr:hypothetical protein DID77_00970 [Candidatus Marinamargulisbacteria bacterium SCGC AG-439-L15]